MAGDVKPSVTTLDTAEAFGIVGDSYRILAGSEQTGGGYMIMHARVPPGGGPPRHVHSREHEGFYVLAGKMTFEAGEERFTAGPGTFVNLPPCVAHRFANESDAEAEVLILCAPGGIEAFFKAAGDLCRDGAPDPADLAGLAARYGIEFV